MKLPVLFTGLLFLQLPAVFAAETFSLNEKTLAEVSLSETPQWESIEAAFLEAKSESEQLHDKFRPEIFGDLQTAETKEKAIIQFQPIWSPQQNAQLGVRQNFRAGVGLSAGVGADRRNASTVSGRFKEVSTSTVRLDLQVDLWKDLFGRLSKAQSNAADFVQKRAEIERNVQRKAFQLSLRRTYWSLVANNEQIKVYEGLKKISQEQLADATRRKNAGVADLGEVARYEAQVASREGSRLYYMYQREILLKQLKSLLPSLQSKEVVLSDYDIPNMIKTVLACTATIANNTSIPYDYTQYDEITSLLRQNQKEQSKLASSYDDVDLKFIGSVKTTGVASKDKGNGLVEGSINDAFNDWQENDRTGYSAGLQLVIPLGKGETRKTQELLAEKRFNAQIKQNDTDIISTHQQLVKVIGLLSDVVRSQKLNTLALERRLQVQNRKFREARVSANDLILDQDALLNSNLTTISTQLEIINTIFDYLVVFTETPCEFNRI